MGATPTRPPGRRRSRTLGVLLTLVGMLVASLSLTLATPSPASAETGTVVGQVISTTGGPLKIRMLWFDKNWGFLGQRKLNGNIYNLTLPHGTYHLQFVDLRPSYDITKYAPTDIKVTIGDTKVQRDVKMRRGAALTGTVKAGGKPAGGARVVAANTDETSYETKANSHGQFALGGLPTGDYSVFTYDRQKVWVGKSTWVPKLVRPEVRNVGLRMKTKAGSLLVDLLRPDGSPMTGSFFVTAVSRASGQFWTMKAQSGTVSFQGLYPGRYKLVAPGVGIYLPRTGVVEGGYVRSGRADLSSHFSWTKRGAWLTGYVVDKEAPDYPLKGVLVVLYDRSGNPLASATTNEYGHYNVSGPLTTQDGLTVSLQPNPDGGGWLQGENYCQFDPAELTPVAITTGLETPLPDVELAHHTTTNPLCAPSEP
jgi:hypothetical protein